MIITILFLLNTIRIKNDTGSADDTRGHNLLLICFSLNTLQKHTWLFAPSARLSRSLPFVRMYLRQVLLLSTMKPADRNLFTHLQTAVIFNSGAPGNFSLNSPQFLRQMYMDNISYWNRRCCDGILTGTIGTSKNWWTSGIWNARLLLNGSPDKTDYCPHVKKNSKSVWWWVAQILRKKQ